MTDGEMQVKLQKRYDELSERMYRLREKGDFLDAGLCNVRRAELLTDADIIGIQIDSRKVKSD